MEHPVYKCEKESIRIVFILIVGSNTHSILFTHECHQIGIWLGIEIRSTIWMDIRLSKSIDFKNIENF